MSACLTTATALAASPIYFGGDVSGLSRQRPANIHITSDENINHIHWSSWGETFARAHGTVVFSASDGLPPAPVRLRLSKVRRCGTRLQYLRLVIFFTGTPPQGPPQPSVVTYSCKSPS
ncbi:MAG: hypothetical protein ACR2HD_08665 [Solirubrobacteraceae bacterium]|nr:MAG: hypothetical protein DLM63_03685 [Solirubrobacterales bacterium]